MEIERKMNDHILIFGDICPDNDYRIMFESREYGAFSDELVQLMAQASLVVGNLECPATDCNDAITKCGPTLRAKPKDIETLRKAGFDILSLANNHILDFGFEGLEDTLRCCERAEIQTIGAGHNAQEAAEPIICRVGNQNIAILSFAEAEFNLAGDNTPGANHFDPYEAYNQVKGLKEKSDFVIVLYHGGIEYYKNPSPLLQKKCRTFVRAGADMVLCQHSHCIGTLEKYEDGTILYGQGNSMFGYRPNNKSWNEGFLIDISEESGISFRLLCATKDGVTLADSALSSDRFKEMLNDSQKLDDKQWISDKWERYALKQAALDLPLLYGWNRVAIKLNRILNNMIIRAFYSRRKRMITMNLLRCESHHEVVQTILAKDFFSRK